MKGQESNDLRASRKDQGRGEEQIVLAAKQLLDLRLALRRVETMLDQLQPLDQALALVQVWNALHNVVCADDECPQWTNYGERIR